MRPHAQDLHRLSGFDDLINQTMLNIDAARVCAGEIADELLVRWRIRKGIACQYLQQRHRPLFQSGGRQFLCIFLGVLGIDERPAHQRSPFESLLTGVFIPSRIDLRMPGMDNRYSVSWIAFQSSSETSMALLRLPAIRTGVCVSAA